jgi:hypothetical protein
MSQACWWVAARLLLLVMILTVMALVLASAAAAAVWRCRRCCGFLPCGSGMDRLPTGSASAGCRTAAADATHTAAMRSLPDARHYRPYPACWPSGRPHCQRQPASSHEKSTPPHPPLLTSAPPARRPRPTAASSMWTRSTCWMMAWWMWCWTLQPAASTQWSARECPSCTRPSSS